MVQSYSLQTSVGLIFASDRTLCTLPALREVAALFAARNSKPKLHFAAFHHTKQSSVYLHGTNIGYQISLSPEMETTPSPEEEHPKHTRPHPVISPTSKVLDNDGELQTWSPATAPKNGDSQHRYARCARQTGHGWGEALEFYNGNRRCQSARHTSLVFDSSAPSRTHQ